MADWSDLPMDPVRLVADLLLATNDVDAYVDMRAVCSSWRIAIPKPPAPGGGDDCRFRPREWVMLDEKEPADGVDGRLFLHLSTGRFLRRRLPLFGYRKYILVGASDGLLVLASAKGLHAAMLVNPFTRDMLPFAAPIPREHCVVSLVAGSTPTLLFYFEDRCNEPAHMVYCADVTSPLCEVQFEGLEGEIFCLRSVVSYAGDFYSLELGGGIFKIVGTSPNYHGELIANTFDAIRLYFLVESAGELLLVTRKFLSHNQEKVQLFKVNIQQKVLEPVSNIGCRALFLGRRCLSVDADKLPSVDSNCIYCDDHILFQECGSTYRYDLNNSKIDAMLNIRPFSLAQTLVQYCMYGELEDIPSQLESVRLI